MNTKVIIKIYFVFLFLCCLFLVGYIFWSYIDSIIFAAIIAGVFYPVMDLGVEQFKLSKRLSAALACSLIIFIIFIPIIYIVIQLSSEVFGVYELLKTTLTKDSLKELFFGDHKLTPLFQKTLTLLKIEINLEMIETKIFEGAQKFSLYLLETVNSWVTNILSFLFKFTIMLLVIYAFFVDGARIKEFMLKLSPLPDSDEEYIIEKFNQMNYVTLVCNGLGGLIQGALAGVGFWIAGIQSVLLWTTFMVVLAFIPLVGISIIYIPACIYLYFKGKVIASIVLFIYCTVISILTENWFKAQFIGKRVQINSLLVFFSILGGLSVFGMAGIFYGPLIITIFLTFVDSYQEQFYAAEEAEAVIEQEKKIELNSKVEQIQNNTTL
ncbi:MAG: putative PurR-regulated permease PerM [bacterium]|jgi:predicted PurR-regulated permease PerM